ncbi:MAG TPA: PqqD family protein [Terriglobales bacterium]|nr:PqqD family protein [Terriglobales bacterium]
MKPKNRWVVAPEIRWTVDNDGGVLVDLQREACFAVNLVGAAVWKMLSMNKDGLTLEAIAEDLAKDFEIPVDEPLKDVSIFLNDLRKKKLVEVV